MYECLNHFPPYQQTSASPRLPVNNVRDRVLNVNLGNSILRRQHYLNVRERGFSYKWWSRVDLQGGFITMTALDYSSH